MVKPVTKRLKDKASKDSKPLAMVKRLYLEYLHAYKAQIGLAFFFMAIAAAMTAAFAKLIEPILDDVFNNRREDMIVPICLAVFGCFFVRGISTYIHTVLMNKTGQNVTATIQKDLLQRFVKLDLVFFHKHPSAELSSRIVSDVDIIRNTIIGSFTGLGMNFMTLLFLVIVMFNQDWVLSLIAFFTMPFGAIFVIYIGKRLRKISGNIQQEMASLSNVLIQAFQGIRQVKAYGMEQHEENRVGNFIDRLKRQIIKAIKVRNFSTPFNETLVGLALVGLIAYGGKQVIDGEMTTGELMSFIAAFSLAYEPMKKLAKLNSSFQMGLGAADRVFSMMDQTASIVNKKGAKDLSIRKATIAFKNVSFQYGYDTAYALDNVSFTAKSGQVTALVGASGSGKTTALNLVPRFYDVKGGKIEINKHNIQDVTIESLRSHIALVSQDITIFDDTVRANIAYGLNGATEDQIINAAKIAAADDFIMQLSGGYDTRLGEQGFSLSGGQRQRLSIARAVLRNAPILLLDEATSALDSESEDLIQSALSDLQKGRTVIVVAHRLSTIQDADHIIVLDKGQIIEEGSHADLMQVEHGAYARMYALGLKETR